MKKIWLLSVLALALVGCGSGKTAENKDTTETPESKSTETLQIAAAASMENVFVDELIPMFQKENDHIKIEGVYDASGKLQTQIEEGLDAGLFVSAAPKQVKALIEGGFIKDGNSTELLENKVVLIQRKGSDAKVKGFAELASADTIALGDPASVPIGQYSEEILDTLDLRSSVENKVSYATNVSEVLRWVEEGSADVGIVYATDAASSDKVEVIAEAGSDELSSKVIYPMALIGEEPSEAARLFYEFLQTKEAQAALRAYGFSPIEVK